jgi:hypothetical protein
MNEQRRLFRGRGGPNDRRLPKHHARRRRPHPNDEELPRPPKYTEPAAVHTSRDVEESEDTEDHSIHNGELEGEGSVDGNVNDIPRNDVPTTEEDEPNPCLDEIRHLRKRIRNVQESIQTSTSLVNVSVYQEICLNAVANCVNEWRSIARHYSKVDVDETDSSPLLMTPKLRTETGLAVFQVIQLSLQSGPLAGAKPGYMKRCGGSVAQVVLKYLEDILPAHQALAECMGFSDKQMDAMTKWRSNAEKAALNDKPPSKSVLKQQHQQQRAQKRKGKQK